MPRNLFSLSWGGGLTVPGGVYRIFYRMIPLPEENTMHAPSLFLLVYLSSIRQIYASFEADLLFNVTEEVQKSSVTHGIAQKCDFAVEAGREI